MKLASTWINLVAAVAVTSLFACDFEEVKPYPQSPAPVPAPAGATTGGHRNPQQGFAAPGASVLKPGAGATSTAPGSNAGGDATGTKGPGKIDPACAALPPGDACIECLKGDCCATLLKCNKDKACSCLLKCVATKPNELLNCAISNGCGFPDMSFLTELQTCSKGCTDAKICKLPTGIPGLGGGTLGSKATKG